MPGAGDLGDDLREGVFPLLCVPNAEAGLELRVSRFVLPPFVIGDREGGSGGLPEAGDGGDYGTCRSGVSRLAGRGPTEDIPVGQVRYPGQAEGRASALDLDQGLG